jgi:hypothetical protein
VPEGAVQRCLRFLQALDTVGGAAGRWDLLKIAGNEAAFKRWVDGFLVYHRFLEKRVQEGRELYLKTERGQVFQSLLEDYVFVQAFRQISGRKLRSASEL